MDQESLDTLLQSVQTSTKALISVVSRHHEPIPDPFEPGLPLSDRHALQRNLVASERSLATLQAAIGDIFLNTNATLTSLRSRMLNAVGPIGMLPTEVQSAILWLVVWDSNGAPNREAIFTLWHVSRAWRSMTRAMSELYREADWKRWPVWLIRDWCTLAAPRTLRVTLDDAIFLRLDTTRDKHQTRRAFNRTKKRWGSLTISLDMGSKGDFRASTTAKTFFRTERFPALSEMSLWGGFAPDLRLEADHFPSLRIFRTDTAMRSPMPKVQQLVLDFRHLPRELDWIHHFERFPNIQSLTVISPQNDANHPQPIHEFRHLTELRVEKMGGQDMLIFFSYLRAPSLKTLTVDHCYDDDERFDGAEMLPDTFDKLVIMAPRVTHLSLTEFPERMLTWCDLLASSGHGNSSNRFPHLPSLQSLEIRVRIPDDDEFDRGLLHGVESSLANLLKKRKLAVVMDRKIKDKVLRREILARATSFTFDEGGSQSRYK